MTIYAKIGIVAAIALALAAGVWKIYDAGHQAGVDSEKAASAVAVAQAQAKEVIKVKEIIKWKEKAKVVYRDRIKKIKTAEDPTGCLAYDLRDVGLGGMLRTDSD